MTPSPDALRDILGRFVRPRCTDPNCDGELVASEFYGSPVWACNGLTFTRDDGPLIPCDRTIPRLEKAA